MDTTKNTRCPTSIGIPCALNPHLDIRAVADKMMFALDTVLKGCRDPSTPETYIDPKECYYCPEFNVSALLCTDKKEITITTCITTDDEHEVFINTPKPDEFLGE